MLIVTSFVCFVPETLGDNKTIIRLGHISGYTSVPKNVAAISLAIKSFQEEGRLENYTFE